MSNKLVRKEKSALERNVKRDGSHEEQLDDFLDLASELINVIRHQYGIQTESRFKFFFVIIIERIDYVVGLEFIFSLVINLIILFFASASYADDDSSYCWGRTASAACLPEGWFTLARSIGYLHNVGALMLLINHIIGSSVLNISKGENWKDMLEKEQIALGWGEPWETIFMTFLKRNVGTSEEEEPLIPLPNVVWQTFFVFSDSMLLYHFTFFVLSICGTSLCKYNMPSYTLFDLQTQTEV